MANFDLSPTKKQEQTIFHEVNKHNEIGFQETDRRATGNNLVGSISFDDVDELFRSYIDENNWPYDALLFDPRVFTFIFEKTSRLIANKPKGILIPREGSDALAAKINNALLDYQWDRATHGGSMISKWAMMDMNARKYGASFALAKWRYETDRKGRCVYDGPEMQVLNNRDVAHELSATSIENCNWFQVRQYVTFQDLERINDQAKGKPVYKNLAELRAAIAGSSEAGGSGGDTRGTNWISRNRQIAHLENDPVGKDDVYKTVEIVTEYRRDRWITFSPKHGIVIRDIENPYGNNELPIIMLRYYAIDDDLYGLSEIEPVKGLQKAINAVLCQFIDEINQNLYSPIAIGPGVRQHTLEWGKGARWIMNNPQTDFRLVQSNSNAAQYFQTSYSVLVSAMQNALGESSLGVSNVQPFQNDKTATEVKALQVQRNARDQFNQTFLAEAIKRMMMLWHSMNQKLLFSDPNKQTFVMRIVGKDALRWFLEKGLGEEVDIPEEELQAMTDVMISEDQAEGGKLVSDEFKDDVLRSATSTNYGPKYPVTIGKGKDARTVKKLTLDDKGASGNLVIVPEDLMGMFDFTVDVISMAASTDEQLKQGRQTAVQMLSTNPNIVGMLQMEGVKPKFKELFVTWLEDLGFADADRYFQSLEPEQQPQEGEEDPNAKPKQYINFKDLPPEGKQQMAEQAGIKLGGGAQGGAPGGGQMSQSAMQILQQASAGGNPGGGPQNPVLAGGGS